MRPIYGRGGSSWTGGHGGRESRATNPRAGGRLGHSDQGGETRHGGRPLAFARVPDENQVGMVHPSRGLVGCDRSRRHAPYERVPFRPSVHHGGRFGTSSQDLAFPLAAAPRPERE